MLMKLTVMAILQYIQISNYDVVHLKLTHYFNYTSIKKKEK